MVVEPHLNHLGCKFETILEQTCTDLNAPWHSHLRVPMFINSTQWFALRQDCPDNPPNNVY